MRDGVEAAPDGAERLVRNCAQLHHGLLQLPHRGTNPDDITTMHEILSRIASSAGRLATQANRLAGRVYAPARDYPVRETRLGELLRQQAIIIDSDDVAVLVDAFEAAESATARLITADRPLRTGLGDYPLIQTQPLPAPSGAANHPPASLLT